MSLPINMKKQVLLDTLVDRYQQAIIDLNLDLRDTLITEDYEQSTVIKTRIDTLTEKFALAIHNNFNLDYDNAYTNLEEINDWVRNNINEY